MRGYLSDCDPVVYDGKVVWYAEEYDGSHRPIYYCVDLTSGADSTPQLDGDLRDASLGSVASQEYTGSDLEPKVKVTYYGETLVEGKDYTLSYTNNVNVGTATVKVRGINRYTGSKSTTFTITKGTPTITANDVSVKIGASANIGATATAGAGRITYAITDSSIASITTGGKVTGKASGKTTVTIKTVETDNWKAGTKTIYVSVPTDPTISVSDKSVAMGTTAFMGATITEGAGELSYKSSRTSVVKVDAQTGELTPVAAGTATITVTSAATLDYNSAKATATVTVTQGTPTIEASDATVAMGTTAQLGASVNAGAGTLSYSSSNTGVVKVSTAGVLTPVAVGEAKITVTNASNSSWASTSKTVDVVVTKGIPTITASDKTVAMGKTVTVAATKTTGSGTLSYESSDITVVTVDSSGKLTPVNVGTAVISITSASNTSWSEGSAEITVTVTQGTPTITATNKTVAMGKDVAVSAKLSVGAGELSYTSSDTSAVTVTEAGVLNAVRAGATAEVTISTKESENWAAGSKTITVTTSKGTPTITSATTYVGMDEKTAQLDAQVSGGAVATYTSNKPEIVTVDDDGVLTPVKTGSGTVTVAVAASDDWNAVSKTVTVIVVSGTAVVTAKDLEVEMGKTATVEAKKTDGAGALTFKSDDVSIAKVDANGMVTPVSVGDAIITVGTKGNSSWASASTEIHVAVKQGTPTIEADDITMEMGKPTTIGASVTDGAGELSYKSSNTEVVVVDAHGKLVPASAGTATITITTAGNDNWEATSKTVNVTVQKGVPSIKATDHALVMGETVDLNAWDEGLLPEGIRELGLTPLVYKSSNTKVATVDAYGTVTPQGVGTATITITCPEDNNWNSASETVTVTVSQGTPQITAPDEASVAMDGAANIGATITEGAGALSYKSSDERIVTVDSEGNLEPHATGTATVTVSSVANTNWASATKKMVAVTVSQGTAVVVAHDVTVEMGKTATIEAEATEGAGRFSYASANEAVVKVSSSGVLTPVTAGTAEVKVGTVGNADWASGFDTIIVTVISGTPTITAADVSLAMGKTATISASVTSGAGGLSYSSENEGVVEVDDRGRLTPVAVGSTVVTVSSAANTNWDEGVTQVSVTVTQGSPTITATTKAVAMGTTASIGATVTEGAGTFSYDSSDTTVATVDADGIIHPVKVGSCEVTIKAAANSNWNSTAKTITVKVSKGNPTITAPEEASVGLGYTAKIAAKVTDGAGTLVFKSASESIVKVDNEGNLTPVKAGTTKVTISSGANDNWNAATITIPVTVSQGVATITVSDRATVELGKTAKIEAMTSDGAGKITYLSMDDSIVSVSSDGVLTPKAAGTATIILGNVANSSWASGYAEVTVTVTQGTPTITASDLSVAMDKTAKVSVQVPDGVGAVSYSIDKTDVATVDKTTGLITPVAAGTATITVATTSNENWKAAKTTLSLTVTKGTPTITASNVSVAMGSTATLGASITDGAGKLSYASSDTSVVAIDSAGLLTPVKVGKATISVTSGDSTNWNAVSSANATKVVVSVIKGYDSVTASDVTVQVGQTGKVVGKAAQSTGAITYSSSSTGIVKVNSATGELTPVKEGTATITVKVAADANWYASSTTAHVTVQKGTPVITASDKSVAMGTTASLGATVTTGAGRLTYSSGNEGVVKVSSSGTLTPVSVGQASIKLSSAANTSYEGASKEVAVTVTQGTPTITASDKSVAMGKTVSIGATITSGAGTLAYESLNPEIATVDSTGKVTPVKVGSGSAIIAITSEDSHNWSAITGANAKKITVTVTKGTPTITASKKTVALHDTLALGATVTAGAGKLTYASSDKSIVKVDADGTLTGEKTGTASVTITAAANDNWNAATKTVEVTVGKGTPTITPSFDTASIKMGETLTLDADKSEGVGTLSYKSSNTSVATVDTNTGLVTPVKAGTATITISGVSADTSSWNNPANAKVAITVTQGKGAITGSATTLSMNDTSTTLDVTLPVNHGTVTYTSNNQNIVKVSSAGKLTPVAAGSTLVTVRMADSTSWTAATQDISVTVTKGTPTITASNKSVAMGKTATIGASITKGAGTLAYSSSSTAVVKVDSTGKLTPVKVGTATISITSGDSSSWNAITSAKAKKITVTVTKGTPVITATAKSVAMGKTVSVGAKITSGAGTISYKSYSDSACTKASSAVIKVNSSTGLITPVKVGTAYVAVNAAANSNWYVPVTKKIKVTVTKGAQPMVATAVNRTASFTTLKTKAVTVARPLTVTKNQGALTYAKSSGSSAFKVDKTTGKVTIKKGTKKGAYTIKVRVTAKGNANYKSGSKVVSVKITVS